MIGRTIRYGTQWVSKSIQRTGSISSNLPDWRLARGVGTQKDQIDNFVNSKDYYDQVRQLAKLQGLVSIREEYYANTKDFKKFRDYVIVTHLTDHKGSALLWNDL